MRDRANDRLLNIPNADIVAQIRAGDKKMFGMVFERYWELLVRWGYHHLSAEGDAEEVVADVLASLWIKRLDWNIRDSVEAYLFGAVRVGCLRWRRDAGRRHHAMDELADTESVIPKASFVASPDAIIRDEEIARTQRAARYLPTRYREALMLRYGREMEYAEIATVLHLTTATARVLVSRSVAALRERLAQQDDSGA